MTNKGSLAALPRSLQTHHRRSYATALSGKSWAGTSSDGTAAKLLIDGAWEQSGSSQHVDVLDPSTQKMVSRVPITSQAEMSRILRSSATAYESWKDSSVLTRQRIMLDFQSLIRRYHKDIAHTIVVEQGKTISDAMGDVTRGLQVVQMAAGAPSALLGTNTEVSKDMDTQTRLESLGVGAAICPFNFPAMIPLWSIAMAISTGNTLILKPSERVPGASAMIAELALEACLPKGVLNVMHGGVDAVNFICDAPEIKAISFVGGDKAGKHIYDRAGAKGKRVQAQLGAKNHCILMPDAGKSSFKAIAGAAFGAAGQRCMALSVCIIVGEEDRIPEIIKAAEELNVGNGFDESADVGPVISPQALQKIHSLIGSCKDQGGKIALDGRGAKVEGFPRGNWVGPTVLDATTEMDCYKTEIFGPVLTVIRAKTFEQALAIINDNPYGNGASIFTSSAVVARKFEKNVLAGQVGVNVPIPVPLPMFSWSGNRKSVLGGASLYGPLGLSFWTQMKTTTSLWREEEPSHLSGASMPVHH